MKKGLTEMVFILDKSGSMCGLESDTIGGFNNMIEKQKKVEGEALVTTILFNYDSTRIHDRLNIKEVPLMTSEQYSACGSTALLDAVGNTIEHIKNIHRYIRSEDVPQKTLFVITTDGMENASQEYDFATVKKLIEEQKKDASWEFIFLGANIDATKVAGQMGINPDRTAKYCNDERGQTMNYECLDRVAYCVRQNRSIDDDWAKDIKDYYEKQDKK